MNKPVTQREGGWKELDQIELRRFIDVTHFTGGVKVDTGRLVEKIQQELKQVKEEERERLLNQKANQHDQEVRADERNRVREWIQALGRQKELYKGKFPFVLFGGKADDKEMFTIYDQGLKDVMAFLDKQDK